jgi:hypothetical protein
VAAPRAAAAARVLPAGSWWSWWTQSQGEVRWVLAVAGAARAARMRCCFTSCSTLPAVDAADRPPACADAARQAAAGGGGSARHRPSGRPQQQRRAGPARLRWPAGAAVCVAGPAPQAGHVPGGGARGGRRRQRRRRRWWRRRWVRGRAHTPTHAEQHAAMQPRPLASPGTCAAACSWRVAAAAMPPVGAVLRSVPGVAGVRASSRSGQLLGSALLWVEAARDGTTLFWSHDRAGAPLATRWSPAAAKPWRLTLPLSPAAPAGVQGLAVRLGVAVEPWVVYRPPPLDPSGAAAGGAAGAVRRTPGPRVVVVQVVEGACGGRRCAGHVRTVCCVRLVGCAHAESTRRSTHTKSEVPRAPLRRWLLPHAQLGGWRQRHLAAQPPARPAVAAAAAAAAAGGSWPLAPPRTCSCPMGSRASPRPPTMAAAGGWSRGCGVVGLCWLGSRVFATPATHAHAQHARTQPRSHTYTQTTTPHSPIVNEVLAFAEDPSLLARRVRLEVWADEASLQRPAPAGTGSSHSNGSSGGNSGGSSTGVTSHSLSDLSSDPQPLREPPESHMLVDVELEDSSSSSSSSQGGAAGSTAAASPSSAARVGSGSAGGLRSQWLASAADTASRSSSSSSSDGSACLGSAIINLDQLAEGVVQVGARHERCLRLQGSLQPVCPNPQSACCADIACATITHTCTRTVGTP